MEKKHKYKVISFRLPINTEQKVLSYLDYLKENSDVFSQECLRIFLNGLELEYSNKQNLENFNQLIIELPRPLDSETKQWAELSKTKQLLGTIMYALIEEQSLTLNNTGTSKSNNKLTTAEKEVELDDGLLDFLSEVAK